MEVGLLDFHMADLSFVPNGYVSASSSPVFVFEELEMRELHRLPHFFNISEPIVISRDH